MFDIDKILGKKKSKKSTNFSDMTFSKTFGKNPFSDMVGGITKKPLKNMSASKMPKIAGASIKMQSVWKNMTPKQKMVARTKYPDTDRDGVPNKYDCQPRNPMRQEAKISGKVPAEERVTKTITHGKDLVTGSAEESDLFLKNIDDARDIIEAKIKEMPEYKKYQYYRYDLMGGTGKDINVYFWDEYI